MQDAVQRPLAEAMEPPSDEEVAGRRHALYHRPHAALVTVIALIALFLLAWAVFVQLRTIRSATCWMRRRGTRTWWSCHLSLICLVTFPFLAV